MADTEINYIAVLADLEERKAKLDAAIEGIRAILGESSGIPIKKASKEIESDSFFGISIVDATKKYLRMVKSKKSTTDIVTALEQGGITHTSKNFTTTVYSVLFREMNKTGEIVRVGQDWGLAEWYPGMRKARKVKNGDIEEESKEEKPEETIAS